MDKANILVVDDEAVVREGVRRILEGDRYSVESCASGRVALALLQEKDFNMVIDGKASVIKNHGANDTLNNPVSPQSEMDYQAV